MDLELFKVFRSFFRFEFCYLTKEGRWERQMLIYDKSKAIREAKSSKKWKNKGAAARFARQRLDLASRIALDLS